MPQYDFKCLDCTERFTKTYTYEEYAQIEMVYCPGCNSLHTARTYDTLTVKWSAFGIGPTHRYRDPKVEKGLQYEREAFGEPLTDELATQVNEEQGL